MTPPFPFFSPRKQAAFIQRHHHLINPAFYPPADSARLDALLARSALRKAFGIGQKIAQERQSSPAVAPGSPEPVILPKRRLKPLG